MAERKRLAEGVTDELLDRDTAEEFIYKKPRSALALPAQTAPTTAPGQPSNGTWGRVPLTSRVRADLGLALKRASLERELAGAPLHTVQEILDAALELWLREHGYLPTEPQ